jgi:hypothetical protein
MTPTTAAIIAAVAKALAAKAPAHPHYIGQPMREVAGTLIQNLKETYNGNSDHLRRRPDVSVHA